MAETSVTVQPPRSGPVADDGLGERFRSGDEDALREAYLRFGPAVEHLAAATLRNTADAEDVVQVTFVAADSAGFVYTES